MFIYVNIYYILTKTNIGEDPGNPRPTAAGSWKLAAPPPEIAVPPDRKAIDPGLIEDAVQLHLPKAVR